MKYLFFVSALVIIFSGTSLSASAQKRGAAIKSRSGTSVNTPLRFIEAIELSRDDIPATIVNSEREKTTIVLPAGKMGIEQVCAVQFKYAQLLNRDVESANNLSLYNFIDDWWETRYRYGGTTKSGIDCSAFTGLLLKQVYASDIPRTAREQFNVCEKLDRAELTEGDLVFFNTRGGVSHVGVYLGDGYFVHASTSNGVTINNLEDDYYSARFLGGGKMLVPASDPVMGETQSASVNNSNQSHSVSR